MRKLVGMLAMLLACLSFAACSDDDKVNVTVDQIIGEWKIVKVDGSEPAQPMTMEVTSSRLSIDVNLYDYSFTLVYDYVIDGDRLILDGEDGSAVATVLALTETTATIRVASNEDGALLKGTIECVRI